MVYVDVTATGKCTCGGHDSGCISDVSSCGNGENADSCLSDDAQDRLPISHAVGEGSGDSHSDSSSQSSACGRGNNVLAVPSCVKTEDHSQRAPLYAKHKGWVRAPPKLVQPLKEIPPRFKKLLTAHAQVAHKSAAFKRSQYTRAPLVKQSHIDGGTRSKGRRGVNSGGHYSFNPEAESFIPGQKYKCIWAGVAPSSCQCVQQTYIDTDGATPVDTPHPTYTIHIPGGFPPTRVVLLITLPILMLQACRSPPPAEVRLLHAPQRPFITQTMCTRSSLTCCMFHLACRTLPSSITYPSSLSLRHKLRYRTWLHHL